MQYMIKYSVHLSSIHPSYLGDYAEMESYLKAVCLKPYIVHQSQTHLDV